MSAPQVDSVVQSILDKFIARSVIGKKKYGTDLDRQDLSPLDWIQHAQEEHMDAILYLEKLKRTLFPLTPLTLLTPLTPQDHHAPPPPPEPEYIPSSAP